MKLKICTVITSLIVCWFGTVVSQELCTEPSETLLNHALMINGVFAAGNPGDSEKPSALQELYFLSLRPVDIPALGEGIYYYFELMFSGRVVDRRIMRLTDAEAGFTRLEGFEFINPEQYASGNFDIANLTALQESDISPVKCTNIYKETRRGNFIEVEDTPGCSGYQRRRVLWTCNAYVSIPNEGRRSRVRLYRDRYPLSAYLEEKTQNFNFRCNN